MLGFGLVSGPAAGAAAAKPKPAPDILGIRLGMAEADVRAILTKVGTPETDLASLKQAWKLNHKNYGHLAVRYSDKWTVKWVSAYAADAKKKLKYSDIGPLDKATRTGNYIYTWEIPGGEEIPGVLVTARGSDPRTLGTLSISALPIARDVTETPDLPDTMYLSRP